MSLQEEYKVKQEQLLLKYREKVREEETKKYKDKIGTIVTDHIGRGRVLNIVTRFYQSELKHETYFNCENLTKELKTSKREPTRWIYLQNTEEFNN